MNNYFDDEIYKLINKSEKKSQKSSGTASAVVASGADVVVASESDVVVTSESEKSLPGFNFFSINKNIIPNCIKMGIVDAELCENVTKNCIISQENLENYLYEKSKGNMDDDELKKIKNKINYDLNKLIILNDLHKKVTTINEDIIFNDIDKWTETVSTEIIDFLNNYVKDDSYPAGEPPELIPKLIELINKYNKDKSDVVKEYIISIIKFKIEQRHAPTNINHLLDELKQKIQNKIDNHIITDFTKCSLSWSSDININNSYNTRKLIGLIPTISTQDLYTSTWINRIIPNELKGALYSSEDYKQFKKSFFENINQKNIIDLVCDKIKTIITNLNNLENTYLEIPYNLYLDEIPPQDFKKFINK